MDGVAGYNTHSIVLQVPIRKLTRDHKLHDADEPEAVIGVYATASRQRVRVLQTAVRAQRTRWVQISRLGEPLINEVVIPRGKKDLWNSTDPAEDMRFLRFYRSPEVTKLETRSTTLSTTPTRRIATTSSPSSSQACPGSTSPGRRRPTSSA